MSRKRKEAPSISSLMSVIRATVDTPDGIEFPGAHGFPDPVCSRRVRQPAATGIGIGRKPLRRRAPRIGVAGGKGVGIIFKKGRLYKKVAENELLEVFLKELDAMAAEKK